MKKKNGLNGFLVIVLFGAVCFLAYYIIIYMKTDDNNTDNKKIIINDSLKSDVTDTIDKYLVNIFVEHSSKFCGELNFDDSYLGDDGNMITYYKTVNFESIEDVRNAYSSMISDDYFNDNIVGYLLENEGKLYCGIEPRGALNYSTGNVTLSSVEETDGYLSVKGYYKTTETDMSESDIFNFEVSMIKNNDVWVIDSYEER